MSTNKKKGLSPNRKSTKRPVSGTLPTFESTYALISKVMVRYLHPSLLTKSSLHGSKAKVSWSLLKGGYGYSLLISVRSGAFGEFNMDTRATLWDLGGFTPSLITNTLFHALTFNGSPYRFSLHRGGWTKDAEIAG